MARTRSDKGKPDVLVKSAEFIGWALGGLEREIAQTRERLSSLNAEAEKLRQRIAGGRAQAATSDDKAARTRAPGRSQRRRQMSAEARARISEMMKKRWAERRKANE